MDSNGKHTMGFVAMAIAILLDGSVASAQVEPRQRCTSKGSSIEHCVRSEAEPLLLYFDDFEQSAAGWSDQTRQTIGSDDIVLGGYCKTSDAILLRTYQLPVAHRGLRVRGTVHLLDLWNGEYAYLKVAGQLVWMTYHRHCPAFAFACGGINVAGDNAVADAIGIGIDVFVPHSTGSATVEFGTSLTGDPCRASFAIDDVEISVF